MHGYALLLSPPMLIYTHLHLHTQPHASCYGLHSLPPPRSAVWDLQHTADAKWRELIDVYTSLYHIIIMSVDYIILLSMRRVGFLIAIAYYCLRLWCTTSCIYLQGCVAQSALKKGRRENNSRMCNIGMV